ncbi:MAG: ROK family protein [Thermoleophilia bacterium]|nr:ROK family protein [Thermoleophilia bacterium]
MTGSPETLVIGIDLGGSKMAAGLVDGRLAIIESLEVRTPIESQESLIAGILSLVRGLVSRAPAPVSAAGFGIPSMIDQVRGRAVMSVNIPLADFDFVRHISGELGLPVFIDNDANVAALAEATAGAAAGAREVIMITLGTGIGGGIITGGEVYRGATGSAAELGHMVIDVNGPRCQGACENYGCFETMASGTALARYAAIYAEKEPDSALGKAAAAGMMLDGRLVCRLARQGDPAALKVMDLIGFYLGVGITNLVNIFNPEVLVVGGGLMGAGGLILDPAKKILAQRGLRPNRDVVRVTAAGFGPEAGVIGAACLALRELKKGR